MTEQAEQAADATDGAHRYNGALGIGQPNDSFEAAEVEHLSALTNEEREHNRRVFGQTWRERTGQTFADQRRSHTRCVAYCLTPGDRRRGIRCPSCYGDIDIRAIGQEDIEPSLTRAERLAAWIGAWIGAFCEAVMFPFRVGRAHTEALIRDTLQQSIDAGLTADIPGLADILTVLESLEEELRAIRNAAESPGEGA